jgi:hypothetical protein
MLDTILITLLLVDTLCLAIIIADHIRWRRLSRELEWILPTGL